MKTIKKLTIGLAALLGLGACNVMDLTPTDRYSDATIWANKNNIESTILGFYSTAEVYGEFGSRCFGTKGFSTDGLTWMLKYSSDVAGYGTPNLILFIENQITPSSNVLSYWSDCHVRIRKINEFLDGIDNSCKILTEEEKDAYKAEVRFFRGYLYYMLTRAHKQVIIYDGLGDWQNSAKATSSEAECWNFVKEDLQFAYEHLTADKRTDGRVDKATAAALLSRAMLYAKDYDAAKEACENVIKIGYSLDPDYANIFKQKAGKRSVETIFQVDYLNENYCHSYDSINCPSGDDANAQAWCPAPTQEMVSHYEKKDGGYVDWQSLPADTDLTAVYESLEPRFHASVLYNGASWKGRKIETFVGGKDGYATYGATGVPKTTVTGYYMRKMLDETNTAITTSKSTQSYVMIRYAEVLLNYAEALLYCKTPNVKLAMDQVNAIRARVNLPEVSAGNAAQAMEHIKHEREIELAFEGFHYWDLKRWGDAQSKLASVQFHGIKINKTATGTTFELESCDAGQNRIFPQKYYSLPIPDSEITNNPLCQQLDAWK